MHIAYCSRICVNSGHWSLNSNKLLNGYRCKSMILCCGCISSFTCALNWLRRSARGLCFVVISLFIWFLVSKLLFTKLAFVCSFDFQLFSNGFQLNLSNLYTFFPRHNHTFWSSDCTLSHHPDCLYGNRNDSSYHFIYIFEMLNIFNV